MRRNQSGNQPELNGEGRTVCQVARSAPCCDGCRALGDDILKGLFSIHHYVGMLRKHIAQLRFDMMGPRALEVSLISRCHPYRAARFGRVQEQVSNHREVALALLGSEEV